MASSCGECPNYGYYSGGASKCRLVDQVVLDKERIAPFCPLPDFPARLIAYMQTTVLGLQKAIDYSYPLALLTYVAAKLKRPVSASGSTIEMPTRDGKSVVLNYRYIREITLNPFSIRFLDRENAYVLTVDGIIGPSLSEIVHREGVHEELFHHVDLAA